MSPSFPRALLGRLAAVAAALLITACGGGGIGGTGSPSQGTLRLAMTDAPSCGYDEVNVTVERVRVHQSASAADGDAGWHEIVLSPARRIDLLDLQNGVLEELGQTQLPAGTYTQMRLVLAANGTRAPYANSVIPSGGTETPLTTPSAQQSGLKSNINITVQPGLVADFVLDFDACKSVVRRGASGQYNLKPVITVIPRLTDAGLRIVGYVDPSLANGRTVVSAQQGGVPIKATAPVALVGPSLGRFELPVPAGSYTLVIAASGRVSAVVTGVPVISGTPTQLNTAATAFNPGLATDVPVSGNVAPATATVRALQQLTIGPTIEVVWAAVDALSGDFDIGLPLQAPLVATYNAPAPLVFVSDATAAGRYRIEAQSGALIQTADIDVGGPLPLLNFSFP